MLEGMNPDGGDFGECNEQGMGAIISKEQRAYLNTLTDEEAHAFISWTIERAKARAKMQAQDADRSNIHNEVLDG